MNLFKVLRNAQTFPGKNKYPNIDWTGERLSHFVISLGKFEDTFWKIERVAELLDDSRRKFLEIGEAFRTPENIANFQNAMKDFPLYVDALLLYFRIFVDSLAVLTKQLPGFEKHAVNGRSFRDQKKWFIETMPDVDPEYAAILQRETNRFTTLAGDKPGHGLRNYIVHRMVRTQLFFVPGKTPDENQIKAFLYGGSDIGGVDLLPTIENMVKEFFVFLDSYVAHFAPRIEKALGAPLAEYHDQMFSLLFQFENGLPSAWLFPHI